MAANVQSMVQYWKDFDLPLLQRELDVAATELANRQDESDSSRKKLVELSREFKKTTPEDIRKVVAPLLKSFQAEIDNLSKRSKAAEAAFLNVYKKLIDVPDPMPVLEYCNATQQRVQRLQDLELENRQLRETLNDYNQEFKEVKNQEVTIKQLREKLKEYEERLEAAAMARAKEKEKELQRQFSDKERHLQESQLVVAKKLGDAEHRVTSLQSALESTQSELFDLKSKYDEDSHAKSDEMEMIMNDLERANQRASLAEKEVAQLKEQLAAATQSLQLADQIQKAPDMEQAIDILTRSSLEVELAAKEKEESELLAKKNQQISQLLDDVQRLQSTINTMKETSAAQIAKLEALLEEKSRFIRELEEKLNAHKDYDEMKRELSILKSIEFPAALVAEVAATHKPLEVLLLEKTKSLQAENTGLKVANADVTGPSLLGMPGPFPPPLQTVETFGSILGEEIVASWQRTLSPDTAATNATDSSLPTTTTTTTITTTAPSPTNSINGSGEGNSATPTAASTPNGPTPEDAPTNIGGCSSNATPCSSSPLSSSTPQTPTATPLEAALAALEETKGPPLLQPASLPNGVAGGGGGEGPHAVAPTPTPAKEDPTKDPVEMATLERLQELLRHNIDKYANESLNTLNISRRVRELLSIHNIGQRLFAKYVLGLSQGTVSELLSKPKPWDKLTEKGRDSYRKMHAWACDDGGVFILKSLVPKKGSLVIRGSTSQNFAAGFAGKESGLPSFRQDDAATEERIALILNEAQLAMKNNHQHPHSPHPAHHHPQQPQPPPPHLEPEGCKPINDKADSLYYKESGNTIPRRLRKYENDDIPQEMVARIYQEELAKLMGKSPKELAMLGPPLDFPKDQYLRTQEEIRLALSVYHHELSKLTQHHHLVLQNGVQDLSLPKDRRHDSGGGGGGGGGQHKGGGTRMVNGNDSSAEQAGELERPRSGPRDGCCESPQRHLADNMRHAGSAFTLVRPKTEPGRSGSVTSPNPLLPLPEDSPTVCTAASPLQRMQSITNSLISQPSMPNMPTTPQRPLRAVLPPITQQQFDQYTNLNTEEIVKKVKEQLSQFSISQRLFGESVLGLSQGSVSDLLARPKPWHMLTQKGREPFIRMKIFLEDENAVHKLVASQYKIAPEKLMRTGSYGGSPPACSSKPHHPPKELDLLKAINPPGVHPITVNQVHLPQGPPCPDMATRAPTPDNSNLKKVVGPRAVPHLQPSVYEMAALTQDLDTQLITTKIKETLLANNIGQKIFGEAVLGLSQGSVSELLSKPKPWHMLSIKGREPFIRMQLWLNDPHNVDRLQALKNERREANKRRRSNIEYVEGTDSSESSYLHGGSTPLGQSPLGPAPKKPRVLFSEEQKEALRLAFALDPYPSTGTIEFLAQELRLTPRTITNWFHNHRMRLKQQGPSLARPGEDVTSACPPNGREGITFDPVQFRLLLNQRLLELQKEKGASAPLGPLTYPFYDDGSAPLSGLDLSLSAAHSTSIHVKQEDTENDSNVSSEYNEDSDASTTKDTMGAEGVPSNKSSSSRRKPAAPQWVNPGWEDMHTDDDEEEDEDHGTSVPNNHKSEVIINGVCVRQTEDFDLPSHTEETVRVEPAPAPDHEPDLEREEVDPVRTTSDVSDAPVPKDRLHNIERLEKSLHEMDEGWDMLDDSEERKNNIDKLQQRIEKQDDDEEWEF